MWALNQWSIFGSGAKKERWEAGRGQKAVWAKEQVIHHPRPHPSISSYEIFLSLPRNTSTATFSFAKQKKPQLCGALSSTPSCQQPTFWDQGLTACLAVSTAAKLRFQNRNHFLPRQQQNPTEQWFHLSCISESPGELFKILMPRLYSKPIKLNSLLVGGYPHFLKLPS